MIGFPVIQIDILQLTVSLLVVALLNEFFIKPSVELVKKYYHKAKTQLGNHMKQ
jgi:hypothetical protein